jgi:curved DNA-binding protein CbpA
MRLQRNYYEIMGLPRTATQKEVKLRYYELVRQFHPDRAVDKDLAQRIFSQINLAYRALTDTDKRMLYDAGLDAELSASRPTASRPPSQSPPRAQAAVAARAATLGRPSGATPDQASPIAPNEVLEKASHAFFKGEHTQAMRMCNNLLKHKPNSPGALTLLGDIYVDLGRRREALEIYREVIKLQPANRLVQEKINVVEAMANRAAAARPEAAKSGKKDAGASPSKPSIIDRLIRRTR